MIKTTYFLDHSGFGWPDEKWLAPYFLTSAGRQTAFGIDNDCWGVTAECVEGTEHLPREKQIDIDLTILGNPDLGVLLFYERWSATDGKVFYSKGNMKMLRRWVKTKHGDHRPIGLFIPFEPAFQATLEFMKSDGALPKCIEWVASSDLPEGTFPQPVVTIRDAQVKLGDL
jgi:hypothetical protein